MEAELVFAAARGNARMVAMLLSQGAPVDSKEQGFTPLLAAAQNGSTEVCKLLLKTGKANVKDRGPDGNTPLLQAAHGGHTEVCELLLVNGSDLEEKGSVAEYTALHHAAMKGHKSLLQLLISHKADVNSRSRIGVTPLLGSSQEGQLASVVTLLQAGADPLLATNDGYLPIHKAAEKNHHEVVRILIEQGGCSPDQVKHTALLLQ